MNIAKKVRLHCQKAFSKGEKAHLSGTFDSVGAGYALSVTFDGAGEGLC